MRKLRNPLFLALGLITILAFPAIGGAQEEHPEGQHHEHPEEAEEHPEGKEHADLTADELADAIAAYVQDRAGDDGYMSIEDPKTDEELELKLDKVHRERLSKVAPHTYFACADFVTRDGIVYDLDVFMKGTDPEALEFHDLSIHKVDGEARYTWYEKDGTWKKKKEGEAGEEHPEEHEEHPEGEGHEEHPDRR
ncbi:MAG: hypothetical protein R3234_06940 [Thermoanaerobaculia bacterium]|nr:hypothetical protein [Thermoanaerobaculia bacterium]